MIWRRQHLPRYYLFHSEKRNNGWASTIVRALFPQSGASRVWGAIAVFSGGVVCESLCGRSEIRARSQRPTCVGCKNQMPYEYNDCAHWLTISSPIHWILPSPRFPASSQGVPLAIGECVEENLILCGWVLLKTSTLWGFLKSFGRSLPHTLTPRALRSGSAHLSTLPSPHSGGRKHRLTAAI